jgi:hypothetical protein
LMKRDIYLKKGFSGTTEKGLISVECSIVLLVLFMLFFLVFSFIKVIETEQRFTETINSSALKAAHNAYFVKLFNDTGDSVFKRLEDNTAIKAPIIKELLDNLGISDSIKNFAYDNIEDLKKKIALGIIKKEIEKNAIYNKLDPGKIEIIDIKIPQNQLVYERYMISDNYIKIMPHLSLVPQKEDIILIASYKSPVKIPFINKVLMELKKTSITKGWLSGSFRNYQSEIKGSGKSSKIKDSYDKDKKDKDKDKKDPKYVYKVENSNKYHDYAHCTGLNFAKFVYKIPREYAEEMGYELCENCKKKWLRKDKRTPIIIPLN